MLRPRTLVLSLLAVFALGLVGVASASAAPEWKLEELNAKAEPELVLLPTESLTTAAETSFLLEVAAVNVHIICTAVSSTGAKLIDGNTDSAEKIVFTGCTVQKPATTCKLKPAGTIETGAVTTKLSEDANGTVWDSFEATGGIFTTIILENCALEGNFKVAGKACGFILEPTLDEVTKLLQFSHATVGETCINTLTFGTHPATLEGEAEFKLSGANVGKAWSPK